MSEYGLLLGLLEVLRAEVEAFREGVESLVQALAEDGESEQ